MAQECSNLKLASKWGSAAYELPGSEKNASPSRVSSPEKQF